MYGVCASTFGNMLAHTCTACSIFFRVLTNSIYMYIDNTICIYRKEHSYQLYMITFLYKYIHVPILCIHTKQVLGKSEENLRGIDMW